ncbi:gag-pol polyprotein [Tanacetum coccineum]
MFLNMDQLEKQLDKEEFQEIGSIASFKVLETHQFQMLFKSQEFWDDEYVDMTRNKFLQYTRLDIPEFRDTLIQNMDYVKKSIEKRALHKMEYDSRVNERLTQTTEEKVDSSKALDASLVIIESNGTESQEQDTSSRSGNDAHVDDADIRPIYNEEPMAENAEQCHDTCPLPATLTDNQTTELSNQSLESENIRLKKTVAQFQKDFLRMEAHCVNLELKYQNQALKEGQHGQFSKVKSNEAKVKHDIDVIETINIELEHSVAKLLAENEQLHKEKEHLKQTYKDLFDSIKRTRVQTKNQNDSLMEQLNKKSNENADVLAQIQKKGFAIAALKNELRKLTGNSVNTKFAKPSILGKPVRQPLKNQSVVRQPTAFKSERPRISKPRFASQVDVNNDLSKPVTTHHLPKGRESAPAKPHHMIAPSSSRYSSNDIVHNHYLEEAKKKTHEHSRIPRNFSDSKHFVCSTCQKCVFNANHDACVIKFLKEVNSRAKVPSNKTTTRNKPVEQTRFAKKPERQISKGHMFSIKNTSVVHKKTMTPRSCLRWKPTGRIFKTIGLRWVPTGKIFAFSTNKVDSEPPNGSKEDITNQCESEQALDVSADISENRASRNFDLMIIKWCLLKITLQAPFLNVQKTFDRSRSSLGLVLHQMMSDHNSSDLAPQRQEMSVENVSSGLEEGIDFEESFAPVARLEADSGFELTAFSDADHAGCLDTRKSTSGGIQFLGDKLVSWMSKKQNCTAMSSAGRMKLIKNLQIQARVEADEELAQRLQAEEREMYTEAEQARILEKLINKRKRYFAAQRAEERRNKPPTQAQQRTYMSNYIKHMGKSDVDRAVPELATGSLKRDAEDELDQESSKRKKTGESSEITEEPRDKEADEIFTLKALGSTGRSSELEIILRGPFNKTNNGQTKRDIVGVHLVSTEKGNRHRHAGKKEYPCRYNGECWLQSSWWNKIIRCPENFLGRYSCRLKDQEDEVFGRILSENKILIQET